ncbi:hypothetical protein FA10DRAFT_259545 [Acaromyces ingoldii]|uniref:Uncharacterized protein n=1 Tax=Acaromyces ingoldii TaxID=215250 RepID=A0A316YU84_9BASI|nr:hypothetical protein FA10DRAFT_259545 [Acaromyces ingoldii]PWN92344.1 hypothetical protein FA10DRAFT_259545 [Acaromyces ingoldii]
MASRARTATAVASSAPHILCQRRGMATFRPLLAQQDQATPPKRKSRFSDDGGVTLEHFLLRSKASKLWRDFLRASRNIPNPQARRETIDWLRDEHFEGRSGLRSEMDVTRIRELLVAGGAALKRIHGPMELAGGMGPDPGTYPKLRGRRGSS